MSQAKYPAMLTILESVDSKQLSRMLTESSRSATHRPISLEKRSKNMKIKPREQKITGKNKRRLKISTVVGAEE
jgi:hypothetical protein